MYKCQRILCYKKSLILCYCVSTVSYCVLYRTLCIMKRTLLWVTLNELLLINSSEKNFLFAVKFYSTHVKTCQEVLVYVKRFWNNCTTEREGNKIIIKTKNGIQFKEAFIYKPLYCAHNNSIIYSESWKKQTQFLNKDNMQHDWYNACPRFHEPSGKKMTYGIQKRTRTAVQIFVKRSKKPTENNWYRKQ